MAGGGYVLKRELTRWEYKADGEIVRESVREDGGLIEPMLTVTRTSYDTTGHISATETTKDWGLNGVIDERLSTQFTYDSAGHLISEQPRQDWDGDGVIDERKTVLYDANGNETRSATSSDWNGDGVIDSRELVRSTYDAAGNLTRRVDTGDRDGDGDIDSREITTTTYDAAGNPTRSAVTIDDFADGVINSRTVAQTQYDKDGRPIMATFRRDWDGDGTFDENSTTRYTYDEAGRLVRQVDTLPEELYRSVHRFAYDEAGRLILDAVSAVDSRRDFTQIFRTEYNDAGQVVFQEVIRRQDFISDAYRSVTRTTYDEAGRKMKEVYLTDWDMDSTIDSKTVSQYHYTPDDFVPATLAGDALLA